MTIKGLFAAAAGLAMVTATTASAAPKTNGAPVNPAASLSVTRAAAPSAHASRIGASVPTATLISIGVLAALVVVVLVATKEDSDSN